MSSLMLNKERLIQSIEAIQKNDLFLNKTSLAFRERDTKKAEMVENQILSQFVAYCHLIQLLEVELNIEQSPPKNHLALIYTLKRFEEFFWKHIPHLINFKAWDVNLAKYGYTKCDNTIFIELQHMGFGQRLYMFKRRAEVEHSNTLQKVFRQEVLHQKLAPDSHDFMLLDLDLEMQENLLKANLMDLEDACLIIQCAERMYQAISRFVYLTDVRKKAMDLHVSQKELDPEKAIVMIQSRTRGMLARKKMKKMRELEHRVLGLTVSSLLQSRISHRRHQEGSHNLHVASSMEQEFLFIPLYQIQLPTSLNELLERFRSELFMADPLELESGPKEQGTYKKYDQETENLIQRLTSLNACRVLNQPGTPLFDQLTSFQAQIQTKMHTIQFDLRNFLYLSAVIPHVLSGWPKIPKSPRHTILLVGHEGSGKSSVVLKQASHSWFWVLQAWASALANKCGAMRINIGKKATKMGRNRFYSSVLQLVNTEKYSFVLLDRLEVFSNQQVEHKNTHKKLLRGLIHTLIKDDRCQVVGMTREAQLEPELLDLFNIRVSIEAPCVVERFELIADTLSRRLEAGNLHRMPRRLLEHSRATSSLTCGATIEKTDKKYSKGT